MLTLIQTLFFKKTQDIITGSMEFDDYEGLKAFVLEQLVKHQNTYAKTSIFEHPNDFYAKAENEDMIYFYTILEK